MRFYGGRSRTSRGGARLASSHCVTRGVHGFQDKVLGVLTRLESRVDALTRHVEAWDEQMRQELAICKVAVSAQVMATYEGSKDSHTTGGGEEVSPSIPKHGKGKVPYIRGDKGKGKGK